VTGHLDEALVTLLARELPDLFGGTPSEVQLTVSGELFELDPGSADAQASEPRPDDRVDNLAFDRAQPQGPYTLSQPPVPGPCRVRLVTILNDRVALADSEVRFDPHDPSRFTLALHEDRELAGVTGIQVLYGVTAVFTRLKYGQDITLVLQAADTATADKAESLAVAVIALNRPHLVAAGAEVMQSGHYGAEIEIKSVQLVSGTAPSANTRRLLFRAEIELKATRALDADEGTPIRRIGSPGAHAVPERAVDIRVDVDSA
jgi:hypothetical protein